VSDLIPENELAEVRKMATAMSVHPNEQVRMGASATLRFVKHIDAQRQRIAEIEGLAARGGTMTAEDLDFAETHLSTFRADVTGSVFDHLRAQGTRIAALETDARRCCPRDHNADGDCDRHPVGTVARLEQHNLEAKRAADEYRKRMEETLDQVGRLNQHISDLEKSLESARKERDEAERERVKAVISRDGARSERDEYAKAEEEATRAQERIGMKPVRSSEAIQTLVRERDAAVASRDALDAECSSAARGANMLKEQLDAAVADNAALPEFCAREAFRAVQRAEWGHNLPNGMTLEQYVPHAVAEALKSRPHPGAALLERMKRLEAALNAAAATMWRVSQYGSMVIETAGELQRNVRALRPLLTATCHDGSCVVCRSGEPCH
jgi:hypothetical protein